MKYNKVHIHENHTRIDFAAGYTMDNIHGCTARSGIDVTVHLYPLVCVLLYRQPICLLLIVRKKYMLYQKTWLIRPYCLAAVTHSQAR